MGTFFIGNILARSLNSASRLPLTVSRNMSKHSNPWVGIQVQDLEGETRELAEQWESQRTVLFLVRRFG